MTSYEVVARRRRGVNTEIGKNLVAADGFTPVREVERRGAALYFSLRCREKKIREPLASALRAVDNAGRFRTHLFLQ
jgi:hypothetical protein